MSDITFDHLPNQIIFEIFTHLDYASFLNASSVCLKWNKIIEENIDFFSSYFVDAAEQSEGEEQDGISGKKRKVEEIDEEASKEEQQAIVNQINSIPAHQFYELLGVAEDADESEIRNQYKKLALMVHPDKNKQPGADQAFKTIKRAFDAIMSGVDPYSPDVSKMDCPDPSCTATVYMTKDKFTSIIKGMDIGACRACKQKFGRIFCTHCFAAWTMTLNPELNGTLAQCSVCNRQFAISFPKPSPTQKTVQNKAQTFKKTTKKKKNWWEVPGK